MKHFLSVEEIYKSLKMAGSIKKYNKKQALTHGEQVVHKTYVNASVEENRILIGLRREVGQAVRKEDMAGRMILSSSVS